MDTYRAGAVYVCAGVDVLRSAIRLDRCLIIAMDRHPDTDVDRLDCRLYWCERDQDPTFIGNTALVPLGDFYFTSERVPELATVEQFEKSICSFVSFLGDREAYRLLLTQAGYALAKRLLLKARDLAALQAFAPTNKGLTAIRKSGVLSKLLVHSEQQFALLALEKIFTEDRLLRALPPAIATLRAVLEIEPSTRLEFIAEYGRFLGETQPINVVIGANGVGKTRLLLALAQAARRGDLKVARADFETAADAVAPVSDILSFTYESALWAGFRRSGATVVSLGVGAREWKRLTVAVRELARAQTRGFAIPAYAQVLKSIVDPTHLFVPIAGPIRRWGMEINGKYYESLPVFADVEADVIGHIEAGREIIAFSPERGQYQLSSGQRSLMLLVAQLFLHGERAVVLVDEPENHLHPQYVTLLMRTLRETLVAMESRAIVVTHSPFVVRELDKSAVQILDKDDSGLPCLYQTSLQTFGGDVGRISEYVFADRQVKKGYEELIQRAILSSKPDERVELASAVAPTLGDSGELYLQRIMNERQDAN